MITYDDVLSDLYTQVSGTPLLVTRSDIEWTYYISETPRYKFINYYDDAFYLPMPYIHYMFTYWGQFNQFYLEGIYFSRDKLSASRSVSYPFLPNFYKGRPCHPSKGDADVKNYIQDFWNWRFTRDGHLYNNLTWQDLRYKSNAKNAFDRRTVLNYWQDISSPYFVIHDLKWNIRKWLG